MFFLLFVCFFYFKIEEKYISILCGISSSKILHGLVLGSDEVPGDNPDFKRNYTNGSS